LGKGHSNQIARLHYTGSKLVTGAMDDSVRVTPVSGDKLTYGGTTAALDAPCNDVATSADGSLQVAVTNKSIFVIRNGSVAGTTPFKAEGTAVALSPDSNTVLVGARDNTITKFKLTGSTLKEEGKLTNHRGFVTRIVYSPSGQFFASADANREVLFWDANGSAPKNEGWVFHTARINDLAWSPDSKLIASVSLDQNIIVWNTENKDTRIMANQAHPGGINAVRWLDNTTLLTAGQDCALRSWTVTK